MKDNYIELSMKYISVIFDKNVSVKTGKIDNVPQNDDFEVFS